MATEECLKPLLERRSIRRFQEREVPLDLLLRAVDVARWAPSARNLQPWEFVIIRDRGRLVEMSRVHPGAKPLEGAAAAIVVLADTSKYKSAIIDASIAATYLHLALHCLGLGSVWIQTVGYEDEWRRLIRAPQHMYPVAVFAVGWPAEKPKPKPRRPLEEMVHLEEYGRRLSEANA